jgi:hypothetical protein
MKSVCCVVLTSLLFVACGSPVQAPAPAPAAAGPTPQPYGNLAQVMRAIPFPNSNMIFDSGNEDPEAKSKKKPAPKGGGGSASANYSEIYGGWQGVEQAAIALSETANLIMIPGRMCENGKPAPLDKEDYQKAAAGLAEAGKVALKAAQSKNLDMMLEAGGTVTEACSKCHEVYRDKDNNADRCVAGPTK